MSPLIWRLPAKGAISRKKFSKNVPFDPSLQTMPAQGTAAAGRMKNSKSKTAEEAGDEFRNAFCAQALHGSVSVQDIMDYLGISDKTVYARLKKMDGEFVLKKGRIYLADDPVVTGVPPAP